MENVKMGIRDLIKDLNINKNKIEFANDLNLFLNIITFNNKKEGYYNILKEELPNYMKKWNLNVEESFSLIARYVKSNKLPYKITKDEGFDKIKSEKFIISMLVELYTISIILENEFTEKDDIILFIEKEFNQNNLLIDKKDIILKDVEYFFKDEKIYEICKARASELREELNLAYIKIKEFIEKRRNIKLNLSFKLEKNIEIEVEKNENEILIEEIHKLKKEIENKNHLINEYENIQILLQSEIVNLKTKKFESLEDEEEIYSRVLINLIKNMNDVNNGNLMDRLYRYSKGDEEQNLMFLTNNLFNVFRQMGICPRETVKVGESVSIEEYSFYDYRLSKDISDIKNCKGEVIYPAWFYKSKEILKPYVNIKGE